MQAKNESISESIGEHMVEWVHVGMWRAYGLYGAYGIEADLGITRGFREGFGLAPGEVWKVSWMAEICFLF